MYKILLADDEGIVIDSLKMIIQKNYGDQCEIESAKTGRSVIEMVEVFRPDIIFMDIQMPGINGIDAMREIRRTNPQVVFIVVSAYDKFDYARDALNLGALDYINKPFDRRTILDVLARAMGELDQEKKIRSKSLEIREKMETVQPLIENGFIYSILFQDNFAEETENYKNLLDIKSGYGFMEVVEFGSEEEGKKLTNAVGTGIRLQKQYMNIRETIREFQDCITGSMMGNKIMLFVPADNDRSDYNFRTDRIEKCRAMVDRLQGRFEAEVRVGIGRIKPIEKMADSYREALEALSVAPSRVAHAEDLPVGCSYDSDYPIDIENELFDGVGKGNMELVAEKSEQFFNWMEDNYPDQIMDVRLKVLEFVLLAEKKAYESGGQTYHFTSRTDYLPTIMAFQDFSDLRHWFTVHMMQAARDVATKKDETSDDLISRVRNRIDLEYPGEISLDLISREENVSAYYLSRLFKEETGENFMEYLTGIRINKAKELMNNTSRPMKEICVSVGYTDPNYFSRIFKKTTGMTPTEYREVNQK